jgi:hypothetical protein
VERPIRLALEVEAERVECAVKFVIPAFLIVSFNHLAIELVDIGW